MIEKLEIKINKLKKKLDPRVVGVVIFMIFGTLIIFSLEMANNFKKEKNSTQDEYNKAMYLAVSYINNVEVDLAKLLVTSTPKLEIITLADIWKQSNLAKESLEQIPVTQNAMANASKYLTQVSDFSYSLMKQNIEGEKITDEEYDSIKNIYDEAKTLSLTMQDIYDDLNDGRIKWDELAKKGNEELSNIELGESLSSIAKVSKAFQNYEGLIYDGAFSDHLLTQTPKNLPENEVSEDEAKKYIQEVLGSNNVKEITFKEKVNGKIELYTFDVVLQNRETRSVSITKKGCKMYLMIGDRKAKEENLSIDDAKEKGLEFLKKLGINNVKDTYYQKTENIAIINYAGLQDNVLMYPDLIKIKVALDDGEILGIEMQGYIFNNATRDDITPTITKEKAMESINDKIQIVSSDIAIIPTDYNTEILTYEFKGKIDDREFLIYINAKTGNEEKVLLIIDSKKGVLTM